MVEPESLSKASNAGLLFEASVSDRIAYLERPVETRPVQALVVR